MYLLISTDMRNGLRAHKTGTRICRRGCSLFIWADLGGPDVRVSIHYYYKFPNHCNIHVKID